MQPAMNVQSECFLIMINLTKLFRFIYWSIVTNSLDYLASGKYYFSSTINEMFTYIRSSSSQFLYETLEISAIKKNCNATPTECQLSTSVQIPTEIGFYLLINFLQNQKLIQEERYYSGLHECIIYLHNCFNNEFQLLLFPSIPIKSF